MKRFSYAVAAVIAALTIPITGTAQEANDRGQTTSPPEPPVVTQHQIRLDGVNLAYTATVGFMPMKDDDGKHIADIFYTAYTLDGADANERPLTFAFNGGPGSASLWVHLGAMGPKRVAMDDEGMPLPPPYRLIDNDGSWLPFTDLVFIDPVGTGYSRPAEGEDKSQFHGVEEDVTSVGDFIWGYTTEYSRWSSPKFLAGESYGTTRSAGLAGYLQQRHGMYLNGIVLISSVLDFATIRTRVGNDMPNIGFLPTYTATAWYHHKLPPALQGDFDRAIAEAREFALGEYASALLQGSDLAAADRARVTRRMAELTGLSTEYIEQSDLRVTPSRFRKELLREQGLTVARLDSRHTGLDRDAAGENPEYDASDAAIRGPYSAMINTYLRDELGYETDRVYERSGSVRPWDWGSAARGYTYVTDILRAAMSQNRSLRVLVANGYYDLATPFFATEYTFSHLGGDPSLRDRVSMTYYPAGHMMYTKRSSLIKLRDDVRQFLQSASAQGVPATSPEISGGR